MMLRKYTDLPYRIQVATTEQLSEALEFSEFEAIYAPLRLLSDETPEKSRIIVVPSVFECEKLDEFREMGFTRALAHTIGHIPIIRKAEMAVHGGFRLNITNSFALEQYRTLGLVDTILSIEMNLNRVKSLKSTIPYGLIIYGNLPLMLLKRIPDSEGLIDRKGKFLQLIRGKAEAELLNPDTLILSDKTEDFSEIDFAVLLLSAGDSAGEILTMYLNGVKPRKNFTRGLYRK